jgi:NAD(P)-dependent dehydrogenase (short-subunit alcohol dehydrogenase family)
MKKPTKNLDAIPSQRFKGQVAIVVGGAQGIGKAIAVRLRREGAHVVVADIDLSKMNNLSREMANAGTRVETAICDVRSKHQIERLVAGVVQRHRRIDILMYVAGVAKSMPFTKTSDDLWDSTMNINLKGAFLTARAIAPHMIKKRRGKMIFMASTNSWDAEAELAPYNASKAALFLLAKTLARELGQYGIQSNAIGPGLIRTRLTEPFLKNRKFMSKYKKLIPAGRLGLPDDVAGPAVFLASSDADYVNGILLFVDGGQLA